MVKFSLTKKLHSANGPLLLNVACNIEAGQLISLHGQSGAGKTSILRMLGGFMQPLGGEIICNGEVWYSSNKKIHLPPQKRNIGFVFQDYALFPNMNVRENLAFALQKGEAPAIIDELLALTGLAGLQQKKIHALSGGQKQRVALARALVRKPALLLLDEPLAAVDNDMRVHLQDTLLQLHRLYKLTTILVSHHIPEIVKLSDKTLCIESGLVTDYRPPADIFFNNTNGGHTLTGTVLGAEPTDKGYTIAVLIGDQVVKINAAKPMQKGDKISVGLGDLVEKAGGG